MRVIGPGSSGPSSGASASPTFAGWLLHFINTMLGLLGLVVMVYGVVMVLRAIWRHYAGRAVPGYHTQWLSPTVHEGWPPILGTMATFGVGVLIVGMAMTGAWITLLNGLIQFGMHLGQSIQHTVGGSAP